MSFQNLCILSLLFAQSAVCWQGSNRVPSPPEWPLNFSLSLPPFLHVKSSYLQNQYEIYINTDSPKTWQSVGVSGRLLYNCNSKMRTTIFDPFGTQCTEYKKNGFTQCLFGSDPTMPTCVPNFFTNLWTNVSFYKQSKLNVGSQSIPVNVWNVTIDEPNWPALNLAGYEIYTLYVETAESLSRMRKPIGLARQNLNVWYFNIESWDQAISFAPNPPSDCNPWSKLS